VDSVAKGYFKFGRSRRKKRTEEKTQIFLKNFLQFKNF